MSGAKIELIDDGLGSARIRLLNVVEIFFLRIAAAHEAFDRDWTLPARRRIAHNRTNRFSVDVDGLSRNGAVDDWTRSQLYP